MARATARSGVIRQLSDFRTTLQGGPIAFLAVTTSLFLSVCNTAEGMHAIPLLAQIMCPIARKLGIDDIHHSMVVVVAMNIGLMMPPIGVGFYVVCRIGDASSDVVMGAIWPYLLAPLVWLVAIAGVPWISTVAL